MKNLKILALAFAMLSPALLLTPNSVLADKKMNVEKNVKELKTKLNLSSDQETQVRTILEDKKSRLDELRQECHDKIRNVLTDDQRTKFNDLMMKKEDD